MQEIVDEGDYDDEEVDKELIEEDIDDIVTKNTIYSFLANPWEIHTIKLNKLRKKLFWFFFEIICFTYAEWLAGYARETKGIRIITLESLSTIVSSR